MKSSWLICSNNKSLQMNKGTVVMAENVILHVQRKLHKRHTAQSMHTDDMSFNFPWNAFPYVTESI